MVRGLFSRPPLFGVLLIVAVRCVRYSNLGIVPRPLWQGEIGQKRGGRTGGLGPFQQPRMIGWYNCLMSYLRLPPWRDCIKLDEAWGYAPAARDWVHDLSTVTHSLISTSRSLNIGNFGLLNPSPPFTRLLNLTDSRFPLTPGTERI